MNDQADNLCKHQKRLIRIPLIPFAIAMMCGIVTGRYLQLPIGVWIIFGAAGFIVSLATMRWNHLRLLTGISIGISVFALGAGRFCMSYCSVPADSIVSIAPADGTMLATVRGRIESYPQIISPEVEYGYRGNKKILFLLRSHEIKTHSRWIPVSGLLRVSVCEPYKTFQPGDMVELVGEMGRFRGRSNPGGYDARAAGRMSGTWVWFRVKTSSAATVITSSKSSLARWLWRLRATAQQRLTESGDIQSGQLLSALILGDRHRVLGKLNRIMVRAGIAHFLSISGLHLGVFLGFIYAICRLMWMSRRTAAIVMLVVLGAYLAMAEARAPLLRSAIMAAMLGLSVITHRQNSSINALGAAAIILLLIDPLQLLTPGFQLSFAIVAGLILLHNRVSELLFGWWIHRRGLMVYRREQRFRRWVVFRLANVMMGVVTVSVTAWIIAIPLVVFYFGVFSPLAWLLGILFFPLIVAVLIPGYIALGLTWAMPNLSAAVGKIAAAAADLLGQCVMMLDAIPFLSLRLRPVGIFWVVLFYATLAAVLTARKSRPRRATAAVLLAVLIATTILAQISHKPKAADAEFHLLSVGAGQCAVLQTPAGETYLIDAGSMRGNDVYRCAVEPFFHKLRLPEPVGVFVSHANTDHFNILPEMIRNTNVERFYCSDYFAGGNGSNGSDRKTLRRAPQSFMKLLSHREVDIRKLRAGDRLDLGGGVAINVLWPTAGQSKTTTNETSLVLKIAFQGKTILLPGDIERQGQTELLKNPAQLRCDVLVLPHHGGWAKTLPGFVAAANPKIILTSASRDPRKGLTDHQKREKFYKSLGENKSCRYYCTAKNGWIGLKFGAWGIEVETMREEIRNQ